MSRTKIILASIVLIVLGAVGYWYFVNSTNETPSEQSQNSEDSDPTELLPLYIPEGWELYEDRGLGYTLAYPPDWELTTHTADAGLNKERQEQMMLQKNDARILIDPLGRIGANEMRVEERNNLLINQILWLHLMSSEYHRFVDSEGKVVLKDDPTTNGVQTIGGREVPYSRRSDFRVHVYLEAVSSEQEQKDVIDTTIKVLETLTLSQI